MTKLINYVLLEIITSQIQKITSWQLRIFLNGLSKNICFQGLPYAANSTSQRTQRTVSSFI